jgi:heme/copper-type cytochrome/quinol oxidase subunit 2
VIHSWWVPDFGGKTDAIPGFINTEWINITKPGVYRGQCAELCGRGHAFMPIVVVAKTQKDYKAWVKKVKAAKGQYIDPMNGKPEHNGSPVTFSQPTIDLQPRPGGSHGTPSIAPGGKGAAGNGA